VPVTSERREEGERHGGRREEEEWACVRMTRGEGVPLIKINVAKII
jgi:hypothetical protein